MTEMEKQDIAPLESPSSGATLDIEKEVDQGEQPAQKRPIVHQGCHFKSTLHVVAFIFVVSLAQFAMMANLSGIIFPLEIVREGINLPIPKVPWAVSCFPASITVFTPICGQLGDKWGKKTFTMIGWAVLTAALVLLGTVTQSTAFILFRGLAGFGAACLIPNAIALLGTAFAPGRTKTLAFVLFGFWSGGGYLLGGLWGSLTAQTGHWQWFYRSQSVFTAMMAVASYFVIPSALNTPHFGIVFDWLGSLLFASFIGLLYFSIQDGFIETWTLVYVPILLGVAVVLGIAFILVEFRVKNAILPKQILSNKTLIAVALADFLGWISFGIFVNYTPRVQTQLRLLTPLHAVLQFVATLPSAVIGTFVLYYLIGRVPVIAIFGISMLSFLSGAILQSFQEISQSFWAFTFPTMLTIVWGPEWSFTASGLMLTNALEPAVQGIAGGVLGIVTNFAIMMGMALSGNIEKHSNKGGTDPMLGFRAVYWFTIGTSVLALSSVILLRKTMDRTCAGHAPVGSKTG